MSKWESGKVERWKSGIVVSSALLGTIIGVSLAKTAVHSSFSVGRGSSLELWTKAVIEARDSVLVTTYKFSAPEALQALTQVHHRGVIVRLLLDGKEASAKSSLAAKASQAGLDVTLWPTDRLGELHAKFTVIDGRTLIAGSFNLSRAATEDNTESSLVTRDAKTVRDATVAFLRLVGQANER